jgi:hypothetical protein
MAVVGLRPTDPHPWDARCVRWVVGTGRRPERCAERPCPGSPFCQRHRGEWLFGDANAHCFTPVVWSDARVRPRPNDDDDAYAVYADGNPRSVRPRPNNAGVGADAYDVDADGILRPVPDPGTPIRLPPPPPPPAYPDDEW